MADNPAGAVEGSSGVTEKGGHISTVQRLALKDLAEGPLTEYRRGYAHSKLGPFYSNRTIKALERKGLATTSKTNGAAKATKAGLDQVRSFR